MSRAGGLTIALAGGAGSGKTTVARALAEHLGGQASGFGDYLRELATEAGNGTDRTSLQQFGQSLVEADVPKFVSGFLGWAAPPLRSPFIVEGVRHTAVDKVLRAWASVNNRDYMLILLYTSETERAARRWNGDVASVRAIDDHPVERETVDSLPSIADAVIDGSGSIGDVIANILMASRGR